MGILLSTTRFLGSKSENIKMLIFPHQSSRQQNHNNLSQFFSYKALKGLLQKLCFNISNFFWARKNADPILPIQNPLLSQPLVTSYSSTNDIQENSLACTNASEEIIMCSSSSSSSAVSVEKIAQQNAPIVEERVEINSVFVVNEGRWIKHYSSCHRILLVGEGDFSFSACLGLAFGLASNMISTSLNSEAFLKQNYQNAPFNIMELRNRECKVMHGIDATRMANHALLGHLKFDRIIFNFPFAGFFKNLSREAQLRRHRRLVSLFLKNAREMISEHGEIHISHKTNDFHAEWKLESVASSHRLRLIEAVKFNQLDYPGYYTKCGFGGDNNFNCNPSRTYKFGLKTIRY